MKRLTMTFAALAVLTAPLSAYAQHDHHNMAKAAAPAAAAAQQDPLFASYETARQALIKESLTDVKAAAAKIAKAAHPAGQHKIAALAGDLQKAADFKGARTAFSKLSDEMISYRATRSGNRPVVAYCPMEKKSWLQPDGQISNPYAGAAMLRCGEIKAR